MITGVFSAHPRSMAVRVRLLLESRLPEGGCPHRSVARLTATMLTWSTPDDRLRQGLVPADQDVVEEPLFDECRVLQGVHRLGDLSRVTQPVSHRRVEVVPPG